MYSFRFHFFKCTMYNVHAQNKTLCLKWFNHWVSHTNKTKHTNLWQLFCVLCIAISIQLYCLNCTLYLSEHQAYVVALNQVHIQSVKLWLLILYLSKWLHNEIYHKHHNQQEMIFEWHFFFSFLNSFLSNHSNCPRAFCKPLSKKNIFRIFFT